MFDNQNVNSRGTIEDLGMTFVSIPGGTFEMGCSPEDSGCYYSESPQHTVTISSFKMSAYEVTQGQWEAVMGSKPSYFSSCGSNCPVEDVSWNAVQDFIDALNQQTGKNYRLPTEAEWEYAAGLGLRQNIIAVMIKAALMILRGIITIQVLPPILWVIKPPMNGDFMT